MNDTSQPHSPADYIRSARRPVIKIGSSLINGVSRKGVPHDLGQLIEDVLSALPDETALTIVSSGAVALGRNQLPALGESLAGKQALSAIGQIDLMTRWQAALSYHHKVTAQVLLTPNTTSRRRQYLNARATLRELLTAGAVPIINENDAVATDELRYGDNDRLAAMAAGLVGADLLILMTDIDGLYTDNPQKVVHAKPIPEISWDQLNQFDRAAMGSGSQAGTGGMATKLDAAAMAGSWGIPVVLMDGRPDTPFSDVTNGNTRATLITPNSKTVPARKKWLQGLSPDGGTIQVDEGAAKALSGGASLLAVGIVKTEGSFHEGDVVAVIGPKAETLGFGLARVDSQAIDTSQKKIILHRDDFIQESVWSA